MNPMENNLFGQQENTLTMKKKIVRQAWAELSQAKLKLELDFTLTVCRFDLSKFGFIVMIC